MGAVMPMIRTSSFRTLGEFVRWTGLLFISEDPNNPKGVGVGTLAFTSRREFAAWAGGLTDASWRELGDVWINFGPASAKQS